MPKMREKVVRELMNEAFLALSRVTRDQDASGEEVISAVISMAKNLVCGTRDMGVEMASIRSGVQSVLIECHNKSDRVQ